MFFRKSKKNLKKLLEKNCEKLKLDESLVTSDSYFRSYVLLNPKGVIDITNQNLMGSTLAQRYIQTGYIKEGIGKNAERQYCLTALGRKQFEMEQAFSLLLE